MIPHVRLFLILSLAVAPFAQAAERVLELTPGQAKPGDAVMVSLSSNGEDCPRAWLGKQELRWFDESGGCRAVAGLSVDLEPGELPVRVQPADVEADEADAYEPEVLGALEIVPPNFNVRELTVARKFIKPPAAARKRMAADRKAFARAYAQAFGPLQFATEFRWPINSEQTAPFGDLRTFNGKKQSQHYGIDLDGSTGDPVYAANDGTVVMARDNYAAGNTVLVHHGADLYTAYFHLSKFEVKQGQKVKQGQLLGLVGKTGRVTGPHLHFSVKVSGVYVDPASLLRLRFLKSDGAR